MPALTELSPDEVFRLLGEEEDTLLGEQTEVDRVFEGLSCPSCNGRMVPTVDTENPFKEGQNTPNQLGRCLSCGAVYDPMTGRLVTRPDFL